jgi:hypothetical protein
MRNRSRAGLIAAALAAMSVSSVRAAQSCDEACLKGFMDGCLQALAKHDASALPLAATRLSREQLKRGALGYMRSVAFHDATLAPYAESCIRLEDGNVTAFGPHDTPPAPVGRQPTTVAGEAPRPNMLGIGCGKQLDYMEYSFITGTRTHTSRSSM